MAILLLRGFGCEMPIPSYFGEVFLGFDPLNVVRYCWDPKRHILGRKCILAHRLSRSVKKCDLGACWRKLAYCRLGLYRLTCDQLRRHCCNIVYCC